MIYVDESILSKIYGKRDDWSHKYDFGHLLVVGGSKHYSGSPAFNALAALRVGVDLVTVVAPQRAANIVASFAPDLIAYPLDGEYLSEEHVDVLLEFVKKKTAIVVGGGLGREQSVLETVREFLRRVKIPCVVDADAIHAIAGNEDVIKNKDVVLTPHVYEFYVLSGKKPGTGLDERMNAVKKVASQLGVTIILKGHTDVICDGRRVALNRTGSPFMTKGGMGDTLAGICGALLARGTDTFTAACASCYINGKAGELASEKFGESTTASDLIDALPEVINTFNHSS